MHRRSLVKKGFVVVYYKNVQMHIGKREEITISFFEFSIQQKFENKIFHSQV